MGLVIDNSPYVEELDFNVNADLYNGVFNIDVTPSKFTAGGEAYVQGVKIKIVNPLGIAIKDYPTSGFDIYGYLNDIFTYTLPNNYIFGEYTVYVMLVDEDGTEYEMAKSFTLCSPNKENTTLKYGCIGATMTAQCKAGKLIVILNSAPTYRGELVVSTENNLELRYPTVSELAPIDVVLSNFSVPLFEGVYQLVGDVKATYDFGEGVTVDIKYKVNVEKKVVCKLNECCIQGKLEELNEERKSACTEAQKTKIQEKILRTLFLFQAAKNAQDCGLDPSEYILELEEVLECSCSCNCTDGQVGSTIPAADITFTGCGFEQVSTGNTTNIEIYNYDFELEAADDSLDISSPSIDVDNCKLKQTIKVKNVDPPYCRHFSESIEQANALEGWTALALKRTGLNCEYKHIEAPTGFAVTGSTRKSFFGKMEWYDTLTAANSAAVSGETVLLFNDATSETLAIKAGVNYMGVGLKSVAKITMSATTSYHCSINNIKVLGEATLTSTADTVVRLNGVVGYGDLYVNGSARVYGGVWLDNTKTIHIYDNATFSEFYTERHTVCEEDATISNFTIRDTKTYVDSVAISNLGALVVHSQNDVVIFNADVTSTNYTAIYVNAVPNGGSVQLTHSKGNALGAGHGIYFHCGGELSSNKLLFTDCIGRSVDGDGLQIVRAYSGDDNYVSNNRFFIHNNKGYSVNRYGIYSISANMKGCAGFSENNYGIRVAGSDYASVNCYLIDCNAESINSNALYANRDIRIIGGVYQTSKDAPDGYPILLTKNVIRPTENYVIVKATTIAVNTSPTCYAIKGDGLVNLRVSNCDFLNFFLDENVPAIDPSITLRNVNIDYYDNIS